MKMEKFTLAENWKTLEGMVLKAGTEVFWYDNGKLKSFTLAEDWQIPLE